MEQPEPLTVLNALRLLGTTYWEGGLAEQPYLLVMELNAAMKGKQQYDRERTAKVWETLTTND